MEPRGRPAPAPRFANLTVLRRAPDPDGLRAACGGRRRRAPPAARVVAARAPRPAVGETTDFDLDDHLRWVASRAGVDAAVRRLAVDLAAAPFDRSRPLWEFTVVEGLPDGRAAMVQKMHHTITDGKGGIRMSLEFIDLGADAPEPTAGRRPPPPEPIPPVAPAVDAVTAGCRARRGVAPPHLRSTAARTRARDPARRAAVSPPRTRPTTAARWSASSAWSTATAHRCGRERSLDRQLETFEVPLAEAKGPPAARRERQRPVRGRGHRRRRRLPPRGGRGVDELRMSMPVSTRTDRSPGGNAFTPTRVSSRRHRGSGRALRRHPRAARVTKTERAMGLDDVAGRAGQPAPHPCWCASPASRC